MKKKKQELIFTEIMATYRSPSQNSLVLPVYAPVMAYKLIRLVIILCICILALSCWRQRTIPL